MRLLKSVLALLVVVALVGFAAQDAGAQKKKGKGKSGKVTKLDIKDGVGTITILVKTKDDKEGKEMTYKITKDTKVSKASGKKGEKPTPAAVADLAQNQFATVIAAEGSTDATVVIIGAGKKKKGA
jgi:hypothetical protein